MSSESLQTKVDVADKVLSLFDESVFSEKIRREFETNPDCLLDRLTTTSCCCEKLNLTNSLLQAKLDLSLFENSKLNEKLSKMTSLSKMLQEKNKSLMEETKKHIAEQEQHRADLQVKFQHSLKEIESKIEEEAKLRSSIEADRLDIVHKFKDALEQFSTKENLYIQQAKLLENEKLLALAKFSQEEKSKKEAIKVAEELHKKSVLLENALNERNQQISEYSSKYSELVELVNCSHESLKKFSTESKQLHHDKLDLELKNRELKDRLARTAAELASTISELKKERSDKDRLVGLCRALQSRSSNQLNPGDVD
ncbi:hypothetical protein RCL1_008345 [Eukaryota sp. TZLM3-RCL]